MAEQEKRSQEERGAIQHLERALETEEMDDANYHVRQALQLLGVK